MNNKCYCPSCRKGVEAPIHKIVPRQQPAQSTPKAYAGVKVVGNRKPTIYFGGNPDD